MTWSSSPKGRVQGSGRVSSGDSFGHQKEKGTVILYQLLYLASRSLACSYPLTCFPVMATRSLCPAQKDERHLKQSCPAQVSQPSSTRAGCQLICRYRSVPAQISQLQLVPLTHEKETHHESLTLYDCHTAWLWTQFIDTVNKIIANSH